MLLTVYSMFWHKKSHRYFFNTIKICTQAAQQKILIQTSRHLAKSILQNIAQYVLYIMQHSGAAKFFKILKSGAGLPNSAVWLAARWENVNSTANCICARLERLQIACPRFRKFTISSIGNIKIARPRSQLQDTFVGEWCGGGGGSGPFPIQWKGFTSYVFATKGNSEVKIHPA